jgi:hypothetical protein
MNGTGITTRIAALLKARSTSGSLPYGDQYSRCGTRTG